MARNPKIRINFEADVQYLLRLKHAIENDDKWPEEWKNQVLSKISDLSLVLMQKPEIKNGNAA